ncbi:hypothetical protein B0O79_3876 [Flavobacteriaceae bacterium MAR_2009_75]|nr:hypothetical protein B0O79_3876 [Flavobacteriaceae bacterium MAR_2009_75]
MLEKIDKIQELLNVPNVDAEPKTAIVNMKILNLLVDLRAESQQLILSGVSISFIEQVKKQIEYHKEQETNRSKVKDYSQAIYHDNRRGALEDLLLWIKLNER